MQTSRATSLHHLIFPPATPKGGGADAAGTAPAGVQGPVSKEPKDAKETKESKPQLAKSQPGVVYTSAASSIRVAAQAEGVEVEKMPLDALISFGQSRGLFTKITYSKEGVMGGIAVPQASGQSQEGDFVSSAVNVMRDFEEGLTALRGTAGKDNARLWNFFSR